MMSGTMSETAMPTTVGSCVKKWMNVGPRMRKVSEESVAMAQRMCCPARVARRTWCQSFNPTKVATRMLIPEPKL